MIIRNATDSHHRCDDGCTDHLREFDHIIARIGADDSASRKDHRGPGSTDEFGSCRDIGKIAAGIGYIEITGEEPFVDVRIDGIDWEVHMDRSGTSCPGKFPSHIHRFRELGQFQYPVVVLGDWHHEAECIYFLERSHTQDAGSDLSGEDHHRHGVRICGRDTGNEICGTGAAGSETDSRPTAGS